MMDGLTVRVLPESQRRTLAELADDLDLTSGDSASKISAFWTMLTLSAVIATAGVLSDSTATVIGAMIIAPLSTPIMGIALGIVNRQRRGATRFVLFGGLLVIGVGVLFSAALPGSYDLLGNSQIASRTSPGLLDVIAAVATGFAGAVALARRDVAAVLPGVAIAISLVPPLAVVGVCLGQGAGWLAVGALLLFLSNLLALVLAGTVVYAVLGYGVVVTGPDKARRRARVTVSVLFLVVVLPLVANTVSTYLISVWTSRVQTIASSWISGVPDASVTSVDTQSRTFYVHIRTTGDLPPMADLLDALDGQVPDGLRVVVDSRVGRQIDAGTVGQ
jgi:uncharacterized hydrophobic protein (TIGR00271 family)